MMQHKSKRHTHSGYTVHMVFPNAANKEVDCAVLSILTESYEERLEVSFAGLTSQTHCATMAPAP